MPSQARRRRQPEGGAGRARRHRRQGGGDHGARDPGRQQRRLLGGDQRVHESAQVRRHHDLGRRRQCKNCSFTAREEETTVGQGELTSFSRRRTTRARRNRFSSTPPGTPSLRTTPLRMPSGDRYGCRALRVSAHRQFTEISVRLSCFLLSFPVVHLLIGM